MKPENAPGARVVRKIRVRALLFLVLALAAGTGAVFLAKRYMDRARRLSAATSVQTSRCAACMTSMPARSGAAAKSVSTSRAFRRTPEGACRGFGRERNRSASSCQGSRKHTSGV